MVQAADDGDVNEKLVISYLQGNVNIHIHETTVCTWTDINLFPIKIVGYLPCVSATSNIKATTLIVQAGYIYLPQEGGNNYKLPSSYSMQGSIDCKGERVCTSVTEK